MGSNGEKIPMQYDRYNFHGTYQIAWEGFVRSLSRRYQNNESDGVKAEIEKYITELPCPTCGGKRLKKEALCVTVGGKKYRRAVRSVHFPTSTPFSATCS